MLSELTSSCQTVKDDESLENSLESDKYETNPKSSSWFGWFGKSSQQAAYDIGKEQEVSVVKEIKLDVELANSSSALSDENVVKPEKKFRKSIRLTSEQLGKFNLKRGSNEVEFSVTTAFQGTTRCSCHIYLWHHSDKVSCIKYMSGKLGTS